MSVNVKEPQGIMVALITQYKPDGGIDLEAIDEHVKRLLAFGIHGFVPGGSTGEFTALTTEERKQLVEQVVKSSAGRAHVMAGIGELSTAKAVDLAVHAAQVGAHSLMVVPPFYDAPNKDELKEHMREIHEASGLPIVYYNIPTASGVSLTPKEIADLNTVGVKYLKDTSGNAPALTDLLFTYGSDITTFNGWDTLTFYGLAAGAKGSVWGTTNILPELSMELWDALAVKGDLKKGREVWAKIFPLCKVLESYNYCAGVKTAMELRGWKTGGIRKPFKLLVGEPKAELEAALKHAGVL